MKSTHYHSFGEGTLMFNDRASYLEAMHNFLDRDKRVDGYEQWMAVCGCTPRQISEHLQLKVSVKHLFAREIVALKKMELNESRPDWDKLPRIPNSIKPEFRPYGKGTRNFGTFKDYQYEREKMFSGKYRRTRVKEWCKKCGITRETFDRHNAMTIADLAPKRPAKKSGRIARWLRGRRK